MVEHMKPVIFDKLAAVASVGIFTKEETLNIFPEYDDWSYKSSLAGYGGARSVCAEYNVLCTDVDPYGHRLNVLTHEFAHTVHYYASTWNIYHEVRTKNRDLSEAGR